MEVLRAQCVLIRSASAQIGEALLRRVAVRMLLVVADAIESAGPEYTNDGAEKVGLFEVDVDEVGFAQLAFNKLN